MNERISFRVKSRRLLELVQILYQNEEIDVKEKGKIIKLIQGALKTSNTNELNKEFRVLSYGILMTDVLDECLHLTCN